MKVKSIVKDYLTGKEYVAIKDKEDLPIKGYANVYLYNARTGKLELEAHTPNVIMPEIYEWLKSYQWDKFCTGAYNKTNSYNGYWEMDNIYLTDSIRPETERIDAFNYTTIPSPIWGNQIGWANKSTYVGSDTQRGSPNSAESYANNTRIHWVFDWPTHAANGTFQTIIWANQLALYGNGIVVANAGINSGTEQSVFGLASDGTYLYALNYDGNLYKLSTNGQVISSVSTGISQSSDSGFGLACDGTYLYALSFDGKLYKLSTSGEVIGSAISTGMWTEPANGFGLTYDGTYLYAIKYTGELYKLSTSGQVIGSAISTGITCNHYSSIDLASAGGYLFVMNQNGILFKISTNGQSYGPGISCGISSGTAYSGFGVTYHNNCFYAIRRDGYLYKVVPSDHYFARTLLASPVTKTSTQTMKIQYDFVYG